MGKTRYEDIESSRFDDKLRKMVPNSYEQKLATHLQPWKDHRTEMEELNAEITADEKEHERLREVERRQGMLDKYHQNKQFMQEWQSQVSPPPSPDPRSITTCCCSHRSICPASLIALDLSLPPSILV